MKNVNRAKHIRGVLAAAVLTAGTVTGGAIISAAPASAQGYDCPGGLFCAWDGVDGTGSMFVQEDNSCVLHDIGNGGVGDRMVSYWNRTGKNVDVLNWNGKNWELLAHVPDSVRGTLPAYARHKADAIKVCA
ncbi:hypothetical protein JMUB6875_04870 [Nocardia sp. JMUB6875]|uniref:peptidase inhibitor family I36 protein n=1 Tax=Nocardia sp. JMUB6875 TaxID=3158170 RepID=UPI0032E716D5